MFLYGFNRDYLPIIFSNPSRIPCICTENSLLLGIRYKSVENLGELEQKKYFCCPKTFGERGMKNHQRICDSFKIKTLIIKYVKEIHGRKF